MAIGEHDFEGHSTIIDIRDAQRAFDESLRCFRRLCGFYQREWLCSDSETSTRSQRTGEIQRLARFQHDRHGGIDGRSKGHEFDCCGGRSPWTRVGQCVSSMRRRRRPDRRPHRRTNDSKPNSAGSPRRRTRLVSAQHRTAQRITDPL